VFWTAVFGTSSLSFEPSVVSPRAGASLAVPSLAAADGAHVDGRALVQIGEGVQRSHLLGEVPDGAGAELRLQPGVGGPEDTPKFQYLGYVLGTAHSPGYPLYTILTHAPALVPIGSLAWRINLFSAICGAVTVAFAWGCARELGASRIRVNAICPGIIDTFRMDDIPRGEAWDNLIARQVPLGRSGSGDDIAWMVVYLCSDQGSWISGQLYTVDGGTLPGR